MDAMCRSTSDQNAAIDNLDETTLVLGTLPPMTHVNVQSCRASDVLKWILIDVLTVCIVCIQVLSPGRRVCADTDAIRSL
jgi:hypothetical protein